MTCPYCNRHQMYKGENGLFRCPYCHDEVAKEIAQNSNDELNRQMDAGETKEPEK